MLQTTRTKISNSLIHLALVIAAIAASPAAQASLAVADTPGSWLWDVLIVLVVAGATLGSAVLPWSALRHWQNRWRYAALAPLVVLGLILLNIAVARVVSPQSHSLWLFEVFAWAMLNMVYMVTIFTAKRMLEKADAEQR